MSMGAGRVGKGCVAAARSPLTAEGGAGRSSIGQEVTIIVTSVLQTPAGRMIFGRIEARPSGSYQPVGGPSSGGYQPVGGPQSGATQPVGGPPSGPQQPIRGPEPPEKSA